ncbi:MAG: hypothetical protein PHT95_06730, partial [Candidatus Omnitrophica bacterium]|nr:hypothetical protein [Candidatus Omnitrophota bacterium]
MYVYKKRSLIFIFSIIDLIGTILAWPFKAFGRKKRDVFARIAVIRIDHVGDVIMSTCVLGPLRKTHPASAIDMVVPSWAYDIVKSSPDITKAMLFDPVWFDRKVRARFFAQARGVFALARLLKAGRYDAVVDLRGDFRHILAMWLSGAKRRISCGVTGGAFLLTDVVPYSAHAHQTERNLSLLGPLGVPA